MRFNTRIIIVCLGTLALALPRFLSPKFLWTEKTLVSSNSTSQVRQPTAHIPEQLRNLTTFWHPPPLQLLFDNKSQIISHHSVYYFLQPKSAAIHKQFLTELGGLLVPREYDCGDDPGDPVKFKQYSEHPYHLAVPSRWIPCNLHKATYESGVSYSLPMLPILDEEYMEQSVVFTAALLARNGEFNFAELGSRWGTWAYRSVAVHKAYHHKDGGLPYHLYLAEPTRVWCDESIRMSALNDITNLTFDCGLATSAKLLGWFTENNLTHLDVLDIDIQGGEKTLVPEISEFAKMNVKVFIIGTHSNDIHQMMLTLLTDNVWEIITSTPMRGSDACTTTFWNPSKEKVVSLVDAAIASGNCQLFNSSFGSIIQWDGEIIAINSKLVPPEDITFYRGKERMLSPVD